jgi:hydroxyacylglutathione hydrolase
MFEQFRQLTPFLFSIQSSTYATNSGIIADGGHVCLIDPCMRPDEIDAIARFARSRGAVETILLTHSHWDHILGPEHFPEATVIAHASFSRVVQQQERGRRRALAEWEAEQGIIREAPFAIPRPDLTFEQMLSLSIGAQQFSLMHAPGHAADQFVLYHAETGLLWAADMLSDLEIPFVEHSLRAYRRTLALLTALDIRILIPGHGTPTTDAADIRARMDHDTRYLADLETAVEGCVRSGLTVEEAIARCAGIHFHYSSENAEPHRLNVETVYLEQGGKADSERRGWGRIMSAKV